MRSQFDSHEERAVGPNYYPCSLDRIRKEEYPTLKGTTYLDHAGTTPYALSTIRGFSKDLTGDLFGNPHSNSPSSRLSTYRVDAVRERLLYFFNADPQYYDLVFVANATAAIKLVIDCLGDYCRSQRAPFWYGFHADSHTSIVGPRELADSHTYFRTDMDVQAWLGRRQTAGEPESVQIGLFAFPGQSNMSGRRLPLSWPGQIRQSSIQAGRTCYSLLDAAALTSTAPLDLSEPELAPDFTALSLYKIFGFPDLGALIVRKASRSVLQKRVYFGGGTVDMVINAVNEKEAWVARKEILHKRLEDGTLPFHNIIALDSALSTHARLYGTMSNVSKHTSALSKILYDEMMARYHTNGVPLCVVYARDGNAYGDGRRQGPTIAFNIRDSKGDWVPKSDVEQLATANDIQLRTGGVCNPGGVAWALNLTPRAMRDNYAEGLRCGNEIDILNDRPTGIVRVSLGAMSTDKDIRCFLDFLDLFVDNGVDRDIETRSFSDSEYTQDPQTGEVPCLIVNKNGMMTGRRCPVASCQAFMSNGEDATRHLGTHGLAKKIHQGRRSKEGLVSLLRKIWRKTSRSLCLNGLRAIVKQP